MGILKSNDDLNWIPFGKRAFPVPHGYSAGRTGRSPLHNAGSKPAASCCHARQAGRRPQPDGNPADDVEPGTDPQATGSRQQRISRTRPGGAPRLNPRPPSAGENRAPPPSMSREREGSARPSPRLGAPDRYPQAAESLPRSILHDPDVDTYEVDPRGRWAQQGPYSNPSGCQGLLSLFLYRYHF